MLCCCGAFFFHHYYIYWELYIYKQLKLRYEYADH